MGDDEKIDDNGKSPLKTTTTDIVTYITAGIGGLICIILIITIIIAQCKKKKHKFNFNSNKS